MKKKPLHVVGAGPAGLSAAIGLASAGREVHLHERYEMIGKRFQGDLQGLENWTLKENVLSQLGTFGLKIDFAATPFHEVTLTDGKSFFKKRSSEPLFYLVKRGPFEDSLDTSLGQQAKEAGVNIHYRSHWPIEKADIIATGPLRRSLAAVDRGIVFSTDHPNIAVGMFHDELAYNGYSYLLVVDGYGCLCTVVFGDFHKLNGCFEKTLEMARKNFKLNLKHAKPVGGVGGFSLNHPRIINETLYVGESAGFQDLLWGFGIRTALTSGHLAAQSILQEQDYNQLVDQKLTPFFKAGVVNRYLWEKLKIRQRPAIPLLLRLPISPLEGFKRLYRYSFIHKVLYPFAEKYVKQHYANSMEEHSDQKEIQGEFSGISN